MDKLDEIKNRVNTTSLDGQWGMVLQGLGNMYESARQGIIYSNDALKGKYTSNLENIKHYVDLVHEQEASRKDYINSHIAELEAI